MLVSALNVEKNLFHDFSYIHCMKLFACIFALFMVSTVCGQKPIDLKRKYRGYYEGVVPGYRMQSGDELLFVSRTTISIDIEEEKLEVKIGENSLVGTYDVMFEADRYFLLDVNIEGQLANERIMVYKRGKKLSRDGMFPQPISSLEKLSKRDLKKRGK